MSTFEDILRITLVAGVEGEGAHSAASNTLDGLDWKLAGRRVADAPYTIQQCANHVLYWNGFSLAVLRGENPTAPEHDVDSWPGPEAPASAEEWAGFVVAFKGSLAALAARIRDGELDGKTPSGRRLRADVLRAMGNHVSYHMGQIALLRRMMGAWPPPTGGDTW